MHTIPRIRLAEQSQRMRATTGLALAVLAGIAFFVLQGNAFGADAGGLLVFAAVVAAAITGAWLLARNGAHTHSGRRHRAFTAAAVDVGPKFERLLVSTAEQALELDPATPRLHALDQERVRREWRAWCADPSTEPFRCTYRVLTADGRMIWVDEETALVVAGEAFDDPPALIVRCLSCGWRYRRPAGHDTLAQHCCPRCEYVGWTAVV